jgi:hypothetical protein
LYAAVACALRFSVLILTEPAFFIPSSSPHCEYFYLIELFEAIVVFHFVFVTVTHSQTVEDEAGDGFAGGGYVA